MDSFSEGWMVTVQAPDSKVNSRNLLGGALARMWTEDSALRLRKRMDYETLPWATFSDPEVAGVGISETRARAEQREIRVYRVPFAEIDRARIDGRTDGFAKVVSTPGGKILGADEGRLRFLCGVSAGKHKRLAETSL